MFNAYKLQKDQETNIETKSFIDKMIDDEFDKKEHILLESLASKGILKSTVGAEAFVELIKNKVVALAQEYTHYKVYNINFSDAQETIKQLIEDKFNVESTRIVNSFSQKFSVEEFKISLMSKMETTFTEIYLYVLNFNMNTPSKLSI